MPIESITALALASNSPGNSLSSLLQLLPPGLTPQQISALTFALNQTVQGAVSAAAEAIKQRLLGPNGGLNNGRYFNAYLTFAGLLCGLGLQTCFLGCNSCTSNSFILLLAASA
ncbi:hypothetical protein BDEG_27785 [Batrachochytrium dendrobatidis JEL423]|uniref:Uncharacterized protein n=1 Tax=Batrachochytrium dendrobatidis (strain JEL423) TaxID=403673 RepID=A0A177WYJ2_BATDL|nr:hypothetical protein BDEG_27785 [Batrachochytrium dendrobatidis JEL423]